MGRETTESVLLYRSPGSQKAAHGTFDCTGASSKEEAEVLIKEGWYLSLPDALEAEAVKTNMRRLSDDTITPEEAEKLQAAAAEKVLAANQVLESDRIEAKEANKDISIVNGKYEAAKLERDRAVESFQAAAEEKSRAENRVRVAGRALHASEFRASAARRALDESVMRVLMLSEAAAKVVAEAGAVERALAKASAEHKDSHKDIAEDLIGDLAEPAPKKSPGRPRKE